MGFGIQWIVDKIAFPSPPSSYSLTSHPELFFIKNPKKGQAANPGVPCMMYAIPQGAPVLLVHAHSNGCDIGDMRQTLQSISEQLRVHVMSFEFPGYGLHLGRASKASIDETSDIVLKYILEDLKVNPAQVIWYGRSIGSGPAVNCAHQITKEMKQTPGGVILQCGYCSFKEVARHLFGRVAKTLVSPLWQNEVMIRDLECPVLFIHGRADKMIPISHSERMFAAVSAKELSKLHACDCGHNDFNFQRCTLRPIYDFLLGVISAPNFPTTNFSMDVTQSNRVFVHHIGPLRSKIPVFSFRRPELEDWLRRLMARKAKKASDASSSISSPQLQNPVVTIEVQAEKSKAKKDGRKGEESELPAIPDFSAFPSTEDVEEALLDPEGMTRSCANRVSDYLMLVQKKLEQVESLEAKPIEEIIEVLEAEFWNSDPLLCLWEEVLLPAGGFSRTRLGPFWIDSNGETGFDRGIGAGKLASPDLLRVPLWVFCPSTAHFRYLAEWALLQSERLERSLPRAAPHTASCCCGICGKLRRKDSKKKKTGKKGRGKSEPTEHPTRGAFSTSLAAHFSNWVEKNDEIKAMFAKFVELYQNPSVAIGNSAAAIIVAAGQPAQAAFAGDDEPIPYPPDDDIEGGSDAALPPNTMAPAKSEASLDAAEVPRSLLTSLSLAVAARGPVRPGARHPLNSQPFVYADLGTASASSGQPLKPPWPSPVFSASVRMALRDTSGVPGPFLSSFYTKLWAPHRSTGIDFPCLADLEACKALLASEPAGPANQVPVVAKNADWLAASVLLCYEQLLQPQQVAASNASSSSTPQRTISDRRAFVDLTRPDLREAGSTLNKAMKLFAHAQQRERREQMRQQLRPTPKVPQPPDLPDGLSLEERLEQALSQPTQPEADPNFRAGLLDADPSTGPLANAKDIDEGSAKFETSDRPAGRDAPAQPQP